MDAVAAGEQAAGGSAGRARSDDVARRFLGELAAAGLTAATCESLTAGLISATLADIPGSSAVLRGGLITYATELKASLAGVEEERLAARGPVDEQVAAQMAAGAARVCGADLGISATGVAGPGPQDGIPAGTVWVGASLQRRTAVRKLELTGTRSEIREASVVGALLLGLELLAGARSEEGALRR